MTEPEETPEEAPEEAPDETPEMEGDPTPTRTLLSFFKAATADPVVVRVRYSVPLYESTESFEREHTLSDAALIEAAIGRGATTWDETDICAAIGATPPTAPPDPDPEVT